MIFKFSQNETESMHKSVLLNEVIENLRPSPGTCFVDGTMNGGGHTGAILNYVMPGGNVIGIDLDEELVKNAEASNLKGLIAVHGNYSDMKNIVSNKGFDYVDGVLLDLGYSSYHIDISGRGFSFQKDEPLSMKYDKDDATGGNFTSVAQIVNSYSEKDLYGIIKDYGEEKFASSISKAIVSQRKKNRIITTFQLVDVIRSAVPASYSNGRINCATRTFQALRIEANNELENLKVGLRAGIEVLKSKGRFAVITFHSLEDRIVKNFFKDSELNGLIKLVNKKPIIPTEEEIRGNPRSRSAKLRVVEKI